MKERKGTHCYPGDSRSFNLMTKTVQVLLGLGADVTVRDDTYRTPLHLASSRGLSEIVRLLIEHGTNVNVLDGNYKTPLHVVSTWVSINTTPLL